MHLHVGRGANAKGRRHICLPFSAGSYRDGQGLSAFRAHMTKVALTEASGNSDGVLSPELVKRGAKRCSVGGTHPLTSPPRADAVYHGDLRGRELVEWALEAVDVRSVRSPLPGIIETKSESCMKYIKARDPNGYPLIRPRAEKFIRQGT
jgi:hypothetical protein